MAGEGQASSFPNRSNFMDYALNPIPSVIISKIFLSFPFIFFLNAQLIFIEDLLCIQYGAKPFTCI